MLKEDVRIMNKKTFAELRDTLLARTPPLRPAQLYDDSLPALIDASEATVLQKAGLHLLNDDIERCHKIAQEHETADGNYWHAILHRREGDFENALYWYARVGKHRVLKLMGEAYPGWTPETFVRECEKENGSASETIQLAEMRFLLS